MANSGESTPRTQKITSAVLAIWLAGMRGWAAFGRSVGEGDRMADHDLIIPHKDLFDQQAHDLLAIEDVESMQRSAEPAEECGERFGETEIGSAVGRLIGDRLLVERNQFLLVGGERAIDTLLCTDNISLQHVDAALGGIGIAGNFQATIKLRLDEAWILDELDNLASHKSSEQIQSYLLRSGSSRAALRRPLVPLDHHHVRKQARVEVAADQPQHPTVRDPFD